MATALSATATALFPRATLSAFATRLAVAVLATIVRNVQVRNVQAGRREV